MSKALPVYVDSDPETFLMNPDKIEEKITIMDDALNSRGYKRLFSEERLQRYREENHLPGNDQMCEEAVCFYQSMLLGTKSDMDDIANAIGKIYENRDELSRES